MTNAQMPRGGVAVMNSRVEPADSRELFPTPPWATRALVEFIRRHCAVDQSTVWEPAAAWSMATA